MSNRNSSEVSDWDDSDDGSREPREIPDFSQPASAPWTVVIPHQDFQKLIKGVAVFDMDDKWLIQTIGPDKQGIYIVQFVRAWLGRLVVSFKVQGELSESGELLSGRPVQVQEVTWELDQSVWASFTPHTDEDAKELVKALCPVLMDFTISD
ncbi:hypothetical protein G7Z17_g590 [Cylindrodendrum hubeiense]|uniref:Uncharacterized protein n=1 Tax=Cylindrodendrum hubeiense TaxID=595255 RepID=A0A9P5HGK0_9HYPO|nr:hypothetical protein G7Z17_g590 [Cylindrodendrum hubeiense]